MKKYFLGETQVGFDVILGMAILDLVRSGMHEDAHHRGFWLDMDNDDLENAINNPSFVSKTIAYIRPGIDDLLREVLESRREDQERSEQILASKNKIANANSTNEINCNHLDKEACDCSCHGKDLILHDHACCSQCFNCGFREKCDCGRCVTQ
jgi:hypothetical protein